VIYLTYKEGISKMFFSRFFSLKIYHISGE